MKQETKQVDVKVSDERLAELIRQGEECTSPSFVEHVSALRELQMLRIDVSLEQFAHDRIAGALLPLVGTADGTSVSCAKKAADEITRLRAALSDAEGIVREMAQTIGFAIARTAIRHTCFQGCSEDCAFHKLRAVLNRPEVQSILSRGGER